MSDLADLLHARVDETARAAITKTIEQAGMDAADPELRQAMEGTLYGAITELKRVIRHFDIDILDALPLVGPWMLRQLASGPTWKVEP